MHPDISVCDCSVAAVENVGNDSIHEGFLWLWG